MPKSLRESILQLDDLATKEVHVEAWNLTLTVRELPLRERTRVMDLHNAGKPDESIVQTVIAGTIDEYDARLFTEEDAAALAEKSENAMLDLYKAIMELSGVNMAGEADTAGDTPAGKPSEQTQGSTTTTD